MSPAQPVSLGGKGTFGHPSPPPLHPRPAPVTATHLRWRVEGWNLEERLGRWEVVSGSEPGGSVATYIGFCSGYFGRWRSPGFPAPSPSGVRYSPTTVLGVYITFTLPGPLQPGLLITPSPCLPPAPKTEAQPGLSSSTKSSMNTLDASNISRLQNPQGKEESIQAEGWNRNCLPCMGLVRFLFLPNLLSPALQYRPVSLFLLHE